MSLILELPEHLEQQLRDKAAQMQVSPEAFVVSMIENTVAPDENSEVSEDAHRQRVCEIGAYVERKNAELYRRLA